jgi:hypothetical protein
VVASRKVRHTRAAALLATILVSSYVLLSSATSSPRAADAQSGCISYAGQRVQDPYLYVNFRNRCNTDVRVSLCAIQEKDRMNNLSLVIPARGSEEFVIHNGPTLRLGEYREGGGNACESQPVKPRKRGLSTAAGTAIGLGAGAAYGLYGLSQALEGQPPADDGKCDHLIPYPWTITGTGERETRAYCQCKGLRSGQDTGFGFTCP